MDEKQFKDRTKKVALRIIKMIESLPATTCSNVIGKQLLRSATSSAQITERLVAGNPSPM